MSQPDKIEDTGSTGGVAVLLVEDVRTNQIVISRHLTQFGARVLVASDGARALDLLCTHRFDVVMLDCDLPDMSGYELARRWRAAEMANSEPATPIIAISASTDVEHVGACFDAGMDGVLHKPVRPAKLWDALRLWGGAQEEPVAAAETSPMSRGAIVGELEDDLGEMRAAWMTGDIERAVHFAHRLTGAFETLELPPLAATVRRLEQSLRLAIGRDLAFDEECMRDLESKFIHWKNKS